jgi:ankyrin repeat protein
MEVIMKKLLLSFLFVVVNSTAFAAQQPDQGAGQPQTPASASLTQARARQAERWRRARVAEEAIPEPAAGQRHTIGESAVPVAAEEPEICSICCFPLNDGSETQTLPCHPENPAIQGHSFHTNCITEWLNAKRTCPICRAVVRINIIKAAAVGDITLVRRFITDALTNHANINPARTTDGATPLHFAAQNGHTDIVSFLVEAMLRQDTNANINPARTNDDATPFIIAAQKGHTDIVRFLVEAMLSQDFHANINPARTDGATPFIIAAHNGHTDIVRFFVEAMLLQDPNANINPARTTDGATPLYFAAQNGHTDIVRFLVEAMLSQNTHANINPARTYGTTPLLIAAQRGNTQIAEYLREQIRTQARHNI